MMGQAFHWANLTVAFLLELCALAALGYWGLRTASGGCSCWSSARPRQLYTTGRHALALTFAPAAQAGVDRPPS